MRRYEEALLGTWLRGEHLEDMQYINDNDFGDKQLMKDLRAGKTLLEIVDERNAVEGKDLVNMTLWNSEIFYKQALAEAMSIQIKREIANMESLDKVYGTLEQFRGITLDNIEEFKNAGVALLNEFNERSSRQVIKWDDLPTLNNYTLGIKRKELTAIAARPSVGKSAFGLQIAYGAYKQGAKVLYFPLEMSAVQNYARLMVMNGYATGKEVQTGRFPNESRKQIGIDKMEEISRSGLFKMYEGEGSIEHIESLIKKEKPFMVVIDQLTQMRADKTFKDIRTQFSYMTSNLKRIALHENVAILLLCQINRDADNSEPTMANLKESGSIEEDSDNVILLHRYMPEDLKNPETIDWRKVRPMLLNLAKQRDGEIGKVKVHFMPEKLQFVEAAK